MIKSITLKGFRHFHDVRIPLRSPYTLICGLNGTGKTTVIEVMNRLQLFLCNGLPVSLFCSPLDVPAWVPHVHDYYYDSSLSFEMENEGVDYTYSITIRIHFEDFLVQVEYENLTVNNHVIFESNGGEATVHSDADRTFTYPVDGSGTGLTLAARNSSQIRDFLWHIKNRLVALSINPYHIFEPYKAGPPPEPILNFDTANFTAWYHYQTGQNLDAIAKAFVEMSVFIPGFKKMFFYPPEAMQSELMADIFFPPDRKYCLNFNRLSHGQKILTILHLLVRIAPANATIAIDELENFLAPAELQPLYNAFQDAYEDRGVQFILTSHHPKTLSWYTDSATVLSFAGDPPTLQAHDFDEVSGQSLIDYLSESE